MIYFDAEMIKNANIKQKTVSKDPEKTKVRVDEVWKSSNNADKVTAEELTGMKRSAIYRVFKKGSVNGKIILAIAQVMNADPFYLTGEIDDKRECTEDTLLKFAAGCGYESLVKEYKSMKRKRQKEDAVPAKDTATEEAPDAPAPVTVQSDAAAPQSDEVSFPSGEPQESTRNSVDGQQPDVCCREPVSAAQGQEPGQPLDEISPEIQELINNISEDDSIMLMKAIFFKAKFSKDNARKADELRKLLVF